MSLSRYIIIFSIKWKWNQLGLHTGFLSLVSMSSKAVVEIIFSAIWNLAWWYLSSIQAGIGSCQAIHFVLSMKTIFHVGFVVKVGHLPTIFLIVIIMSIRWVMRWSNAFCVWSWSPVIKVDLKFDICNLESVLSLNWDNNWLKQYSTKYMKFIPVIHFGRLQLPIFFQG